MAIDSRSANLAGIAYAQLDKCLQTEVPTHIHVINQGFICRVTVQNGLLFKCKLHRLTRIRVRMHGVEQLIFAEWRLLQNLERATNKAKGVLRRMWHKCLAVVPAVKVERGLAAMGGLGTL